MIYEVYRGGVDSIYLSLTEMGQRSQNPKIIVLLSTFAFTQFSEKKNNLETTGFALHHHQNPKTRLQLSLTVSYQRI